MRSDLFKSLSLKARTAMAVAALFLLFVFTASYLTLSYFERKIKESVGIQQLALVSNLAHNIDDKLRVAQNTLVAAASVVPRSAWTDAEGAQRFLDARVGVKSIFDNVVFLMSKEGRLIAESPYLPNRRGRDLSFRDYFKVSLATGKPYISGLFASTHMPGQPVICMTVPVHDGRGNLAGFLGGGIKLLSENFLAELPETRIGHGGYIFVTDSNRMMIVHPDKARIMKPAAGPGINKLYDRAVNGFEGSGETVNSRGIAMLTSYKRLTMTSWILGVNYPVSEAYAPIFTARRWFGFAATLAVTMLLFFTWLVVRRLMSPLSSFTRHVEHLPEKTGDERLVTLDSVDEIGVLATAFNSMIATLDGQREELHQQAQSLEQEVAERQKAQEALAVKHEQLEEINGTLERLIGESIAELRKKDLLLIQQSRQAAMGEMINNIAHQWRQPLNNLGLIVQNLQTEFEMGHLTGEGMDVKSEMAMDTIRFMSRTIDDFRDYFRPDKKKQRFRVDQVVTRTISIIEGSLKKFHINIEINVMDDPVIHGYPNEFSQVILNILNNARDVLTERGIGDPRVMITIRSENGTAVVTIADNAGGISEDAIDRIFDPFFSTKGPDNGTGVGLYMSKEIIEKNMNGRLTARNTGNGAEFRIEV